jgi:hypothetical protein
MKIELTLTFSKIFAFLSLILGFIYSCINKDGSVFITTVTAASALFGVKTYTESSKGK